VAAKNTLLSLFLLHDGYDALLGSIKRKKGIFRGDMVLSIVGREESNPSLTKTFGSSRVEWVHVQEKVACLRCYVGSKKYGIYVKKQ